MRKRYSNGMKENVTRCIQEVHFGSLSRQCLRKRNWWVDGRAISNMNNHAKKLYCRQHALQLANQHEGEW